MNLQLVLGSFAVVGALLLLVWAVTGRKDEQPVTMAVHSGARAAGTQQDLRDRSLAPGVGDRTIGPALEHLGARLRDLHPSSRVTSLAKKIRAAGSPAGWTVERVLAAKLIGVVLLSGLMTLRFAGSPSLLNALLVIGAALFGYFLPDGLLDAKVGARQEAVRREVASVIDQLAVMVRAGLSIDAAVVRIAQTGQGALAAELQRVVQDMRVGVGRLVALAAMAERVDIPELRGFVAALTQADRLGVPVSDTLRVQAEEMRVKQQQAAEEQAMKLPVKILFPMVVCILPVLFIVLLGPSAIRIWEQFRN
jgi:tight adherence protein C